MTEQGKAPAARTPFSGYAAFDDMCWPLPIGKRNSEVHWQLRWGEPTRADLLFAAAVMSAYQQLVYDPESKRQSVIRALREMAAREDASQSEPPKAPQKALELPALQPPSDSKG